MVLKSEYVNISVKQLYKPRNKECSRAELLRERNTFTNVGILPRSWKKCLLFQRNSAFFRFWKVSGYKCAIQIHQTTGIIAPICSNPLFRGFTYVNLLHYLNVVSFMMQTECIKTKFYDKFSSTTYNSLIGSSEKYSLGNCKREHV